MWSPARAVAIVIAMACASCATAARQSPPVPAPGGVRFVLVRPNARSVALAGTFNEWSTTVTPLSRQGTRGVWTVVVPLPPGEHVFMFVIDGSQWITPPLADDYVDDGFGAQNGVVIVRGTEPAPPKPDGEGG
jgi:1,4-alpha-glucan branching enzyme